LNLRGLELDLEGTCGLLFDCGEHHLNVAKFCNFVVEILEGHKGLKDLLLLRMNLMAHIRELLFLLFGGRKDFGTGGWNHAKHCLLVEVVCKESSEFLNFFFERGICDLCTGFFHFESLLFKLFDGPFLTAIRAMFAGSFGIGEPAMNTGKMKVTSTRSSVNGVAESGIILGADTTFFRGGLQKLSGSQCGGCSHVYVTLLLKKVVYNRF
jgi:hypothetical protein